jgi:hypothetical protein
MKLKKNIYSIRNDPKNKQSTRLNLSNPQSGSRNQDNSIKTKKKKLQRLIKKNIQLKKDKKNKQTQLKSTCQTRDLIHEIKIIS